MTTNTLGRRPRRLAIAAAAALGAFGLAAATHGGVASAASVTVATGTGAAATDPLWNVTPPGGSATAATRITTAPSGWTATITGASWIGTSAAPTADAAGSYVYETSVTVPAGSSVSGSIASPDPVTVQLVQGATTTTIPGTFGSSVTTPSAVAFAGPLSAGTYTVRLTETHTDALTPAGLIASFTMTDASTTPAGTEYHALTAPVRVYDSRTGTGAAASGEGVLASGNTRTVSLAQGYAPGATVRTPAVPAGAVSAMVNVTIDGTTATGFLTVYAGNVPQPQTSSINWFGPGQILANLNVTAVAPDGTIKITAGGGGSTQVIVDVLGYFTTPATT